MSRTDLSHDLRDGDSERGVAVPYGNTDLELRDLAVEVPRHQALTQQFDAVHLGLCATSAVVSAPSSPERASEVLRRPQRLVARDRACRFCLSRLGVLAGRDHGIGPAFGDGVVAFARVAGPVGGYACDLLIGRDLAEQFGQPNLIHRRST